MKRTPLKKKFKRYYIQRVMGSNPLNCCSDKPINYIIISGISSKKECIEISKKLNKILNDK